MLKYKLLNIQNHEYVKSVVIGQQRHGKKFVPIATFDNTNDRIDQSLFIAIINDVLTSYHVKSDEPSSIIWKEI